MFDWVHQQSRGKLMLVGFFFFSYHSMKAVYFVGKHFTKYEQNVLGGI